MAVRLRIPRHSALSRVFTSTSGIILLGILGVLILVVLVGFFFVWFHYSKLVDAKLKAGPFTETSMVFAAPEVISVGDPLTSDELVQILRRRGYNESRTNRAGWYNRRADGVEIFPGDVANGSVEPGVVLIKDGKVARVYSSQDNTQRPMYLLEPELITNLFDRKRSKRRLVTFQDIPKVLVDAVVSVEDKRFFQHSGFDPLRIAKTIYVDVKEGRKAQGASTLSMQLARGFWLNPEKTWSRKAAEAIITMQIEGKLTKEQIFEYYVNNVDLGQRKSFSVQGMGEAVQVYLGKDIREITLEDAALLAGMIQRPNFFNPYRHPERAKARRNIVLQFMRENGYISEAEFQRAQASPVRLAQGGVESTDAPYFVDFVYEELQETLADHDFQARAYRVFTTLDMRLQREAVEAVQRGMAEVDTLLAKRKRQYPEPQVALVALDPRTGEIKAMVGGRSYGTSQLNRALAKRQPGSIFKPFVYAAVLNLGLNDTAHAPTPVSKVLDEPSTFQYEGQVYSPGNFGEKYYGEVTMRYALAKSLNVPTVKFAEMAGLEEVVRLARAAGMSNTVKPTPSVALGAYEVTPVEMAGAYTVFANNGNYVKPVYITEVRNDGGAAIFNAQRKTKQVLDPRVNYMVVNLMQDVLNYGTAAGARARGFTLPAAGKTGTSHDAWFAGFTSELLCVVWVGFDNNMELPLEGGKAALPIWTEFMKRAHKFREYRAVKKFEPPEGIVTLDVDAETGEPATALCPKVRTEVFLSGTEPHTLCHIHAGGEARSHVAAWDTDEPAAGRPADTPSRRPSGETATAGVPPTPGADVPPTQPGQKSKEKRSLWDKVRGIFK